MDRRQVLQGLGALAAAPLAATGAAMSSDNQQKAAPRQGDLEVVDGRKRVFINGAWLHYEMSGQDNPTPLIVLHGGRGQGQLGSVYPAFAPMSDRYRVIGFDMRGHGDSDVTGPFTFDQLVDDLEQLRLTLGGGSKMILEGGSFGGFIALSYAVKYPQGLSHLMLRGTAPSYHHEHEAMANFEARAAIKAPAATRAMLEKVFTPTITDDEEFRMIMFALAPMYLPENVKPDYDKIMERCRQGIYRAKVHNDLYEPSTWYRYDVVDRLKDIPVPTLVVCGESDWICDPAQSRLMAAKIPGAKLVVVPNADHAIPGQILERELRSFLDAG